MAYAYVIVTAGKILDFLPINVTEDEPKKKEKGDPKAKSDPMEFVSRICTKCKDYKPGTAFYSKSGYCKGCCKIYSQWRKYDKSRVKTENEDKKQLQDSFFKIKRDEYKQ